MRFWLYFVLFICVITLCISDDSRSGSSESNEDSGEAGGGRARGNNTPRVGGRVRGTVNTNKRGNGNTNQQRRGSANNNQQGRGNGNTNQQSRGTGKTNQQGGGTGNTNQQGGGTGNTNQQGRGTGNTNTQDRGTGNTRQLGRGTGNTRQQGQRPGIQNGGSRESTNQQGSSTGGQQNRGKENTGEQDKNTGKNNGGADQQGTILDTGSQKGKGSDKTGGTNQQGTGEENGKQTTTIKSTQSPSTMVDGTQQGMLGTSNTEGGENSKNDHPCNLTCAPINNPRRRVCGSDGVTYDTYCLLKAARCINPDLKFESRGTCPNSSASASDDSDEETIEREAVPTRKPRITLPPMVPTTEPQRAPTTLPDVVTTRSRPTEVFTTRRATTVNVEGNTTSGLFNNGTNTVTPQTSDALDVTTQAPLNMSGNATVPSDGTTMSSRSTGTAMSGTTQPFAVDCPNLCPILRQLVCGTDGTTYQSPCVLQLVACVNNDPTLMVASLGPCPVSTLEPISAL